MTWRTLALVAAVVAIVVAIWVIQRLTPAAVSPGPSVKSDITPVPGATEKKAGKYPRAKEFVNPSGFINAQPFTLGSLIGKKVILVDFWTYSCINCVRTIPYLNSWYDKYRDKGLEIVGVHTPEFEFEKDIANVRAAVKKFGIRYPVVLDNDYGTWQAYDNQYWPHEYLIDIDGYIVHDHIGEGDYDKTELAIQKALNEHGAIATPSGVPQTLFTDIKTPELYLGSSRNDSALGNGAANAGGAQTLIMPAPGKQRANLVYLDGVWSFTPEFAVNQTGKAHLRLRYSAKQVNLVAGAAAGAHITVYRDGQLLSGSISGADAPDGKGLIRDMRLYELINDQHGYGEHTLEVIIDEPGLEIFTFTFG